MGENRGIGHVVDELTGILEQCIAQGFTVPLYVVIVGANGAVLAAHYLQAEQGLKAKTVAQHSVDGGFTLPVNLMIVDSTGEKAARVTFEASGETRWIN